MPSAAQGFKPRHAQRCAHGDEPRHAQCCAHGDKPRHAQRCAHGDKPRHAQRCAHGDKPRHAQRCAHGDRPRHAQRCAHGDRPRHAQRCAHGDIRRSLASSSFYLIILHAPSAIRSSLWCTWAFYSPLSWPNGRRCRLIRGRPRRRQTVFDCRLVTDPARRRGDHVTKPNPHGGYSSVPGCSHRGWPGRPAKVPLHAPR